MKNTLSFYRKYLGADLADMQFINKFNEEIRFLLGVINISINSTRVIPLKDNKGTTLWYLH